MTEHSSPILITGVGKRVGLALAQHFLSLGLPVIGTFRTSYPELETLKGADLYQVDFYQPESLEQFITAVKSRYDSIRCLIHNASDWLPESSSTEPAEVMEKMIQIHASVPYQLNLALEAKLRDCKETADIIHITDYVAERGSRKHIAYAASKAALSNLTLSFAAAFAPAIKVNEIAPSLIKFNPEDDESYREKALKKSLMQSEAGYEEIIEAVTYLMQSHYVTGRTLAIDGGRHLR